MKITGNEPARPYTDGSTFAHDGLTIRQQFAMAAMQGLAGRNVNYSSNEIANKAISYADALINELNRTDK